MPIVDWTSLVERGYLHERGLVAPELVARARAEIDDDLRRNYDPAREEEYSSRTYCPTILDAPAITDLLLRSGARDLVDAALGLDTLSVSRTQIAIRWAHNFDREAPEHCATGIVHAGWTRTQRRISSSEQPESERL